LFSWLAAAEAAAIAAAYHSLRLTVLKIPEAEAVQAAAVGVVVVVQAEAPGAVLSATVVVVVSEAVQQEAAVQAAMETPMAA
jgi:hypothetical protein